MEIKYQKKFLFITTTNLVTNPRLLKELELVTKNGHFATVMLFELGNWSSVLNRKKMDTFTGVDFITLSANKSPFLPWLLGSLLEKYLRFIPYKFLPLLGLSLAVSKRSFLLLRTLKKVTGKYDWVIAHNPGSFYPALKASKQTQSKLAIDIEDYHPGETNVKYLHDITLHLMSAILPKSEYCSFASPLIMKEIQENILFQKTKILVILNSFPQHEFITPLKLDSRALQLVWFSQNIDFGRGLEILIPEIDKLYPLLELHLIGNTNSEFYERVLKGKKGIKLHSTLAQLDIHSFLASCDVGLAIDMPVNLNRKLALTNKIIAYTQAGLHILATDTPAHLSFLQKMEEFTLVNSDMSNINIALKNILSDISSLRNNRLKRYKDGYNYNWELESKKLFQLWS